MGRYIGSGLTCTGLGGGAIGCGIVLSSVIYGSSRNPSIEGRLMNLGMVFFALVEASALFSLLMGLMILFI